MNLQTHLDSPTQKFACAITDVFEDEIARQGITGIDRYRVAIDIHADDGPDEIRKKVAKCCAEIRNRRQ